MPLSFFKKVSHIHATSILSSCRKCLNSLILLDMPRAFQNTAFKLLLRFIMGNYMDIEEHNLQLLNPGYKQSLCLLVIRLGRDSHYHRFVFLSGHEIATYDFCRSTFRRSEEVIAERDGHYSVGLNK